MESSDSEHNGGNAGQFQPDVDPALLRRRARLAEQGKRISSAAAASERARFWFAVKTAVACVLGCATALLPMGWALHTTDLESARIAWRLGPVIGSTCIVVTLIVASIKWDRDDW